MKNITSGICSAVALLLYGSVVQGAALTSTQTKLLRDPGGWEYVKIANPNMGIQTVHTCFDGKPHPDQCSGTLTFNPDHTFVQKISINHQGVPRHGTWQLDGNQLTFFDELGTRDGPYTIAIDVANKVLTLDTQFVHMKLMLEKGYRHAQAGDPRATH